MKILLYFSVSVCRFSLGFAEWGVRLALLSADLWTHLTSKHLTLHLSSSDLQLTTLSVSSGVQVPVEDTGPPQGSGKSLPGPVGPLDASLPQPPVMETGEAGPPGRMTSSKLPKGTGGSMMPVQGFAGAPGEQHRQVCSLCTFVSFVPCLIFFFLLISQRHPKLNWMIRWSPAQQSQQVNELFSAASHQSITQWMKLFFFCINRCRQANHTIRAQTCPGCRSEFVHHAGSSSCFSEVC